MDSNRGEREAGVVIVIQTHITPAWQFQRTSSIKQWEGVGDDGASLTQLIPLSALFASNATGR